MGKLQKQQHSSYTKCDNCGAIQLTYVPQNYQTALHEVPYIVAPNGRKKVQIIGCFGGYGSGKSRDSLAEIFIRALENPKGTGLLTAPTLSQLKRTTLKTLFEEVIPPQFIESYNKSDMEIKLINGFTFFCIPSDDEEKLRSINAGICHMEEASGIKRTIFDQILVRLRDYNVDNRLFMVCSNPDLGWIREVFAENIKRKDPSHPEYHAYNPSITTFIWATHLNHHLPPDFIAINSKNKPDWWIKRYLEGSFDHSEGMVYPGIVSCFVDSLEYARPNDKGCDRHGIPKTWERFVTLDHGLRNPTAVYFNAINPDLGEVWTYDEYYMANTLIPEHAKNLLPRIREIPHGRNRFMVGDPSIQNKTDPINGKSVQGLYQEYGMFFNPGNNAIEAGVLRVNSYIERGKWKIFRDKCPNLCKEAINYKFKDVSMDDAHKNLHERPVKAKDHGMDSIRYGFMRLPDDPDMLKLVAFEPPSQYTGVREVDSEWHTSDFREHSGRAWESYGY
jgi:hypothetical protein